jgi:ATP-binding cassette subfamily F protein 3
LNQVADRLLVVEPHRFRVIDGNYDTYVHLLKEGLAKEARGLAVDGQPKPAAAEASTSQSRIKQERRKRKFPYRKATEIEAEIHQRERRIAELHELMTSPDALRDGVRARQLATELEEQQQKLLQLYEHWEEATELNG